MTGQAARRRRSAGRAPDSGERGDASAAWAGQSVGQGTVLARFESVSRSFPPATQALTEASFVLRAGESVAITGPSGSGKSTLLTLLGLLDQPSEGRIELLGRDTAGLTDRARTRLRAQALGFVFQAFHLVPHLTARENVARSMRLAGARDTTHAADALHAVGLGHRLDAFPTTMSGGEQQRVAIARALARNPRLLLCDEPTGNLDSAATTQVMSLLCGAQRDDNALVIVTHDPQVAAQCDRLLTVLDGSVTEEPADTRSPATRPIAIGAHDTPPAWRPRPAQDLGWRPQGDGGGP